MNIKSTLGKRIVLDKEKRIYLNLAVIGVIAIFAFFLIFKPAIEGYAVGGREYRYTEKINLTVNGSQEYLWYPDNPGELSSIKITGNLSGSAKVYLEYEGKKYLIFDKYKESVDRITGLAIIEANQTAEINETINLTLNETQINETFGNGTFPNGLETNVSKTIINQSLNETINQTEEIVINQTEELTNETVQINQSIINETPINESIEINQTLNETFGNGTFPNGLETNVSKTINQTEEVVINETLELINITINQTTNETVEEQNQTQEIEIKLEYNSGTNFDPDDNGIEDIDSAIDFIIKEATFNFKLNESNLCSKWDVYSQENKESTILCHGDDECCNFIGVMPFQEDWNDIFYLSYERHGATLNNIVSAQVIYFDYDDTQTSLDIKYSLPASLKAIFKPHFVEFEDICLETCRLEDVGRRPYKLIFELENGSSINIEEITYSMILVNKPPVFSHIPNQKLTKDGIITIDLSEYASDPDEDNLTFTYYQPQDIDVTIDGSIATITTGINLTNIRFMYFIANDSDRVSISNVFKVEPIKGKQLRINPEIRDAKGDLVKARIEFRDRRKQLKLQKQIGKAEGLAAATEESELEEGIYEIRIEPEQHPVKNIVFKDANIRTNLTELIKLDDTPETEGFVEVYAIDPTALNFTEAEVTATAKGNKLFKCKDWNFTAQECYGDWVKLMDIRPGEEYTFTLTPDDPALAELGGIFFDGFETGTFTTYNWTLGGAGTPWYISTAGPYAGTYFAQAENTDAESTLENVIDTTNYINIVWTFYYDTDALDGGEYFAADWYNGSNWINVVTIEDTAGWTLYNSTLPSSADQNTDFRIRFRCSSNNNNEECKVDNVQVTGTLYDVTPPWSVTNLYNQSQNYEWIYWNWTNPTDIDFNESIIYIDGLWKTNTSNNYYNATGLTCGTQHTITVHTKDDNGNINDTDVNNTASTAPCPTDYLSPTWSSNKTNASYLTKTGETVYFNVTLTDETLGGYQRFSFYNGVSWSTDTTTAWSSPEELQEIRTITAVRGYVIRWHWWFNDSGGNVNQTPIWNFTVANTPPILTANPAINNSAPKTNETINCNAGTYYDVDADTESIQYWLWYENNILIPGQTSQKLDLNLPGLIKGDNITCSEKTSDPYDNSTWYNSTTVTIQNTPPTITGTIPNQTVNNGMTWSYDANATDPDVGEGIDSLTWSDDTILFDINSTTGFITDTPLESEAGIYTVLITVSDGTTQDSQSFIYTINDITPPNITLEYPPDGYWNDLEPNHQITFNCSATDGYNLKNISLWITNSANQSFSLEESSIISGTDNYSTWTRVLTKGNYTWNCLVYDEYSNYDWDSNRSIKLNFTYDLIIPVINWINDYPDPVNRSDNITIQANVTDNLGIDSVWVDIQGINYTMLPQSYYNGTTRAFFDDFETGTFATNNWTTSGTGAAWAPSTADAFAGTYSAIAENTVTESTLETIIDTTDYVNVTLSFYYDTDGLDGGEYIAADWYNGTTWTNILTVEDTAGWTLSVTSLPSSADDNTDLRVRFRCLSNNNNEMCKVDNVQVNGTERIYTDIYEYNYNTTPLDAGTYNYTVYARDTYNNDAVPYTGNFTVIWLDYIAPQVFGLIPVANDNFTATYTIEIGANVTDDGFIHTVLANITFPNGTLQQLTLSNTIGDKYNTSFTIPALYGIYNVIFIANDTANNVNNTETTYFNGVYVDVTPPTSDSPSDQEVDIGQESSITWNIDDDVNSGYYYVERNGQLFKGPTAWLNGTSVIVPANNYFPGVWNYTIFFNDSTGNYGIPDTVLITVVDTTIPSCGDAEGDIPVLVNIMIDGNMDDWDGVRVNDKNLISDPTEGAGDEDISINADRDLVEFAFTWNLETLYLYFRRLNSGSNVITMLAYMDYDNDGYMNATDQVLVFTWWGSNQKYNAELYDYTPAGTADYMNGSGYDMPGSISPSATIESQIVGGTDTGIELETRVDWSDLGLSEPTAINFQAASSLGTNVPSQVQDNINTINSIYGLLLFQPDHTSSTRNGTSLYYDHDLMNCGVLEEIIELTNQSSEGFQLTLYHQNGSVITDSNGDGNPDVYLRPYNYTTIIAKLDVPGSTPLYTTDITIITATSSVDTSISETVTDTTTVGVISITPYQRETSATPGTTLTLNYTVSNYQELSDTLEISAKSSEGWNVDLYYPNGSIVADTDGDSSPDLGNFFPSQSKDVLIRIVIPSNETYGTNDITRITINSSLNPDIDSYAETITRVRKRVTVDTDYDRSVGIGESTYYPLTITNNWNESDVIDLTYTYFFNWTTLFFDTDKVTPLSDSDSDGIIDIGYLDPFGGQHVIYVKVTIPPEADEYDSEITTVYVNSSLALSEYDSVVINTTARTLITYGTAARITEQTIFEAGKTVYARAHNLIAINNVYFVWIDSNNTIFRTSSDIPVSAETNADDLLPTNTSMLLGGWVVVVFDAQGDIELGRAYFDLVDLTPPNVTDLRPIAGSMYNISDTVEISANITDNIKVNNAFVNITLPNGTVEQLTLVKTIYNKYNTSFTIPNLPGYYDIRFIARDPSNNTNASETTYFIVGEYEPPSVFNVAPTKNSTFNSSEKIEIGANVTDNVAVDTVLANIALPNGTIQELTLSRVDFTDRYNITYTLPNLAGRFNVTFVANDASGNVNDSETTYFNVKNEFLFQATVKDAVGIPVNITIEFVYLDGTVAYSETKISHSAVLQKGVYNISVKPVNHPVKEILFTNYNANKDIDGIVEIDDTSEQIESSKQRTNFKEIFAINPLLVGFDSAVVTKSAIGEDLYKCSRWVFNERKCYGQWIKIQDISPGENYSFTLTPNDPSFGEGEEKIILTTITVDGNFSDWSAVLQSPNNLVVDGAGSINDPSDLDTGMKANNDLSKFAFTWDDDKIYFYFERVFPARGLTSGLVYIDLDNDGYMNSTDKVVILTSTPAGNYDLFLYDYSPNATADILTGDGFDMPGTVTNQTGVGSNIQGIDADGIKVELEINWSMLGVIAGSPLQMHASLAKGDASVLPDDIEDNSDIATTSVVDILITPNNVIGTQANQSVLFNHTITNRGNVLDVVDVTTSGTSTNWTVQLLYQNGTLLTDTDGDTIVDVGQLSINQSVNIIVNISIPAGQGTIQDITIVTAASSVNANVSDSVTDTIFVGQGITIYPENMGWIAANTTIFYIHTIRNGRGISDVIDVSAVSNNNWSTSLFYANGTPLTDTDSDTIVDVGNLTAGDSVDIKISITIPSVSIGTIDETTLTINSSIGTISSSVIDTTTIAERVIIEPLSQQLQEAGIGTTVFYQFAVYNNWNESDTININFFSSEGWPIELLEQDEVTPLTDTNNDSIIDTGTLDANGGSTTIVMKITVPVGTQVNTTDTTNITATSSLDSSAFDISYVNTSAVILLTFSDAARLQKSTLFSLGDTIYATAFGISQNRIQFYWLDANATLVRSSGELDPGPAGTINDQYTSNVTTDIPGEWVLILHDRKLEEITRTTFFVDIGPPQVVVISPVNGSRFNQSDTVIISANVTDDVQVDTVLANITFPNSTVQQLTLSQVNDTNQYNALFNATNLTGRYNITFIANDTIGNVNDSETTWFYVGIIPPTAPILFSPYYNTSIIDRTPTFIWNNSYDPDFDSLTYEIIVDNSSLFDSPEISTGDIPETLIQTNYTSTIELEVDKVYYWRVRAYDNYTYSNWSTVFYFTLESYAAISLLVDTVNFSTVMPSYTDDTADDNPPPFLLENQGNIQVNITMTGTQMFNSTPFPSDNFQFKIDQNESSAFEYSPSTTSWTNITNVSSRIDIVSLDWHDISDTAEGDIRISVPGEEPSGIRTSNITFSVI